jgi:D-2-hydroxyacid dehydrogenase (NADP+)
MQLETLGIDPSVSPLFPPSVLAESLSDLPVDVLTLDDDRDSIQRCQGVVTLVHRDAFLGLGWVHSIQAGVDRFPHDQFRDADVLLTNSTGIHGDAVGETVAGYLLAFARRLHEHSRNQERGEWSQPGWDEAWTVAGEEACVVGLGSLGRGIVDRLTGLGVDVTGVRRTPLPEPGVSQVYTPAKLETAVADARFVVLAVPLTERTDGMVDEAVFAAMRDDAYLVNVARGPVVDTDALVDALETGEIAGAALDVFETEPLPEDSPLWDRAEVIITPHAGAFTRDYHRHVATIVSESVTRIQNGEDPVNRVL